MNKGNHELIIPRESTLTDQQAGLMIKKSNMRSCCSCCSGLHKQRGKKLICGERISPVQCIAH
jgi:hypothetical protein